MISAILEYLVPNSPSKHVQLRYRAFDDRTIWQLERNTVATLETIKHAFRKAFQLAFVICKNIEHPRISRKHIRDVSFLRIVGDEPVERTEGNWILWIAQDVFELIRVLLNVIKITKRIEQYLIGRFHCVLHVGERSS